MKNYLILSFAILCTAFVSAQSKNITNKKTTDNQIFFTDTSSSGDVGLTTPSKDTLFIEDSRIGHTIKELWDKDTKYKGKVPKIIMVQDFEALVQSRKKTIIYKN